MEGTGSQTYWFLENCSVALLNNGGGVSGGVSHHDRQELEWITWGQPALGCPASKDRQGCPCKRGALAREDWEGYSSRAAKTSN
jgi:hypothetical protein